MMKQKLMIILAICLLLAITTAVAAAAGPAFVRQRFVSVGMQPVTIGSMTLRGTFGQPFLDTSSSGNHTLCTGFWCGWPFFYEVQLPVVLRK